MSPGRMAISGLAAILFGAACLVAGFRLGAGRMPLASASSSTPLGWEYRWLDVRDTREECIRALTDHAREGGWEAGTWTTNECRPVYEMWTFTVDGETRRLASESWCRARQVAAAVNQPTAAVSGCIHVP